MVQRIRYLLDNGSTKRRISQVGEARKDLGVVFGRKLPDPLKNGRGSSYIVARD